MIWVSLLLALIGFVGVVCYSRHIPRSVSAFVYDMPVSLVEKHGAPLLWSVWLVAVGGTVCLPLMELLEDRLVCFGFLTFAFLVGAAVTPLIQRETSDWHDWFGVAAGMMSQCVVAILDPRWYVVWVLYVACLPFKGMKGYLVLVSEMVCAATIYGVLLTESPVNP